MTLSGWVAVTGRVHRALAIERRGDDLEPFPGGATLAPEPILAPADGDPNIADGTAMASAPT